MNAESGMRYLLEQKITPLVNRYSFYDYTDGQKGEQVAFVEQKRLALREQITAWKSSDKGEVVFSLKAEKVFDVHGRFMVRDANDNVIGYLKKIFGKSLLRSTWEMYDAQDNLLFVGMERNVPIALLRRFGGLIPIAGEFAEFLPFNFDFIKDGKKIGVYSRVLAFRDTYDLQIDKSVGEIDPRLALALGIALDALQER